MRADIYGVTDLPDEIAKSALITPFPTLQAALDHALSLKGRNAKVLFLPEGSLTVPMPD